MTVCIAAGCENDRCVVVAADRMVTIPGLSLEVERIRSKIAPMNKNQLVMSSGDGLVGEEVLHLLRLSHPPTGPNEIDKAVHIFFDLT